ncbi:MAG: EamA family transporter [Rhodobacteraceae bacterium]|nr:EamA family transporter [Paracoccaceae bacterium]
MELWIPITIAAAFSQNLRFMLQKHLKSTGLSTAGATFSRFLYAAPLAMLLLAGLVIATGAELPQTSARFWIFACLGGVSQILATMLVVALFAERNFAVGITFKKTETIQTAMFGLILLGEGISRNGLFAILVGLAGVVLLSDPPTSKGGVWYARIFNRAAAYGLGAGALFGFSGIAYRGASLALGDAGFFTRAVFTLMCVTTFQTVAMAIYLTLRERGEISRVARHWRITFLVGLTGMLGSLGWFTAFTLQNAAYVKALGQIELVFTFFASYFIFKERSTGRELAGIGLVVISILILILFLKT